MINMNAQLHFKVIIPWKKLKVIGQIWQQVAPSLWTVSHPPGCAAVSDHCQYHCLPWSENSPFHQNSRHSYCSPQHSFLPSSIFPANQSQQAMSVPLNRPSCNTVLQNNKQCWFHNSNVEWRQGCISITNIKRWTLNIYTVLQDMKHLFHTLLNDISTAAVI